MVFLSQRMARIERQIHDTHVGLRCRSRVSLRSTQATLLVMPALVAGIHVFLSARQTKDVDGRNKSGHDEADELRSRVSMAAAFKSSPACGGG